MIPQLLWNVQRLINRAQSDGKPLKDGSRCLLYFSVEISVNYPNKPKVLDNLPLRSALARSWDSRGKADLERAL